MSQTQVEVTVSDVRNRLGAGNRTAALWRLSMSTAVLAFALPSLLVLGIWWSWFVIPLFPAVAYLAWVLVDDLVRFVRVWVRAVPDRFSARPAYAFWLLLAAGICALWYAFMAWRSLT